MSFQPVQLSQVILMLTIQDGEKIISPIQQV